jgi:simple sugar transport system ATP-binding protein
MRAERVSSWIWQQAEATLPPQYPLASILAEHISKTFTHVPVLKDVTLIAEDRSIHCLAGENGSGKSTLIKIIAGTIDADHGSVSIGGRDVTRVNPLHRISLGLSVIYQDFSLLPNLSVFENITFLDSVSERRKWVRFGVLRKKAQEVLSRMNVRIPLDAAVEELSVASQQLVAIARALCHRSTVIIMDEPTSALTRREVRNLFQIVQAVRQTGVTFIFVTHKLEEIYEICDGVTVLRNGEFVASGPISQFTTDQLSAAITGRRIQIERLQPPLPARTTPPVLEVEELTREPDYRRVTFRLWPGEILGLTGLLGSGRAELALSLAGKNRAESGRVRFLGADFLPQNIYAAQRLGIAYVTDDRLSEGLFMEQEIFDNILIANLGKRCRNGLLNFRKIRKDGEEYIRRLSVKARDGRDPVQTLSGGNQQRVLIARYLDLKPRILILNGPTIGVDVGSKREIHKLIADLARNGTAIIVVSDDMPELLEVCHRVLVMVNGRLAAEHAIADLDLETLFREVTAER